MREGFKWATGINVKGLDVDCSKRCRVVFNSNKWNKAFEDWGPF